MKRMNKSSLNAKNKGKVAQTSTLNVPRSLNEIDSKINSLTRLLERNNGAFLNERSKGLKEAYRIFQDNTLADYIYGIFHPDIVFKENLEIKSPSYLPVPTTTFRFKKVYKITPNESGDFVLFWNPCFLATADTLKNKYQMEDNTKYRYCNTVYNTSQELNGNSRVTQGWSGIPFKQVQQDFDRYRLTSACIKVRYTGKVLDQSGIIAAAATYSEFPRFVVSQTATIQEDIPEYLIPVDIGEYFGSYGDFDNIRQGQWAETCSIVENPDGITCVYVPTDPLSQVFIKNADTIGYQTPVTITGDEVDYKYWIPENTNISYSICGYGIASTPSCISVEAYYNYEIIVKQEQYPYFNPKIVNSHFSRYKDELLGLTNLVASSGLVVRSKKHDDRSIWTKVRDAFTKAGSTFVKVYPYLEPLVKSLV
jgi:hypothetical protein